MNTCRKLRPGEPGTKKLAARYGENLLCVRYRYDLAGQRRLKTVELVVEETRWQPPAEKFHPTQLLRVWIPHDDLAILKQVKAGSGKWNQQEQVWELPYREVVELGLTDFILE